MDKHRFGIAMWLWFDWRSAAIADDDGSLLDEEIWDGWNSKEALADRLELVANGAMTDEARRLSQRFPEARIRVHGHPDLPNTNWPLPDSEGLCADASF